MKNHATFDADDPRWTAYVLGELDDLEHAELTRTLEASNEARAFVASLRETISALESELRAAPPPPALDDVQRQRIRKAATGGPRRWWFAGLASAAAAAALVAFGVWATRSNDDNAARYELALAEDRNSAEVTLALPHGNSPPISTTKPNVTPSTPINTEKWNRQQFHGVGRQKFAGGSGSGGGGGYRFEQYDNSTEAYSRVDDNPFFTPAQQPLSTFSIDVDTASYANIRRFLTEGQAPPKDAVRIEEMINYFKYDYPAPAIGEPFSIATEVGPSPWAREHRLVRISLATAPIDTAEVPPRNLVFLIDVSGSMATPEKLPLLKQSLSMLVDTLRPQDKVSLVVYAGSAGLVLPATGDKVAIRDALSRLEAGGSTDGGSGIQLAYSVAARSFIKNGINRVILCSDGDYNVGITSEGELTRLIERERQRGVFLTVLGFGMGNLKDATMEKLADRGNGNYGYIDSLFEARKLLVEQAGATLVTVAKDVKLQVEFNPATVSAYRLIGYENRLLRNEDFNDDRKDAGEIGAGHAVTALYEIVPAGVKPPVPDVDPLVYQTKPQGAGTSRELMTVKVRYKAPDGDTSKLLARAVPGESNGLLADRSSDFRWAAAIAGFGMLLRESPHRGNLTWAEVRALAEGAIGRDAEGYRKQAIELISRASRLGSARP